MQLHSSLDLIELAKKRLALRHDLPLPVTDYRLAKLLELKQATVSNWRTGKTHIGPEFAPLFARLCEIPEEYVLACIEHERAKKKEVRSIYARIAARFKPSTLAMVLGAAILAAMTFHENHGFSTAFVWLLAVRDIDYTNCAAVLLVAALVAYAWRRRDSASRFLRFCTWIPLVPVFAGCVALHDPNEIAWQSVHAVDAAQTLSIAHDSRCFHESESAWLIGKHPSDGAVAAWAIGYSAAHAGITNLLLRTDHPKLARAWEYVTIAGTSFDVGKNFYLGVRISGPNAPRDASWCKE